MISGPWLKNSIMAKRGLAKGEGRATIAKKYLVS